MPTVPNLKPADKGVIQKVAGFSSQPANDLAGLKRQVGLLAKAVVEIDRHCNQLQACLLAINKAVNDLIGEVDSLGHRR